jgi:hypothetical protein
MGSLVYLVGFIDRGLIKGVAKKMRKADDAKIMENGASSRKHRVEGFTRSRSKMLAGLYSFVISVTSLLLGTHENRDII